jgi:hypothetical protein
VVEALDRKVTSDSTGRFLMGGLAHGLHTVLVRAIGYRPIRLRAYLITNDTLFVDLRITKAVVQLAPLEVTASSIPPGLQDFEERRLNGLGKFIDWTVLRKSEHRRLSDLLRGVPGVNIRYDRGKGLWYIASAREDCPMQIYHDGVLIYRPSPTNQLPPAVDYWEPTDLDAIEVYRGPSETPARYEGTGGKCGTVLLWSRRH